MFTEDEFLKQLKNLKNEYNEKKLNLQKKYALDYNPFKKGDIIEGQGQRIKIETIRVAIHETIPSCFYRGERLTKSNLFFKKREKGCIYQNSATLIERDI